MANGTNVNPSQFEQHFIDFCDHTCRTTEKPAQYAFYALKNTGSKTTLGSLLETPNTGLSLAQSIGLKQLAAINLKSWVDDLTQ